MQRGIEHLLVNLLNPILDQPIDNEIQCVNNTKDNRQHCWFSVRNQDKQEQKLR